MSLAIDVDKVISVLLPDGEWHLVRKLDSGESSFEIDAYEFIVGNDPKNPRLLGGQDPLIPASGASWSEGRSGQLVSCPLTSILAVRHRG